MKNKVLISGSTSGLGKFLYCNIKGSQKYLRQKNKKIQKFTVIIHCGFFRPDKKKISKKKELQIEKNTLFHLNKLLEQCNGKFIFISTIDIYQKKKTFMQC